MELILGTLLFLLAAGGLGLGLVLGRGPLRGSCGGAACTLGEGCAACPRAKPRPTEDAG